MTLNDTKARVLIQGTITEDFMIGSGVRQGNKLSTTIFNILLHYAMGDLCRGGYIINKSYQILAYADDVVIYARSLRNMAEIFEKLEKRTKEMGLIINEDKTKYLRMSRNKKGKINNKLL